jgi:hypothetical protein
MKSTQQEVLKMMLRKLGTALAALAITAGIALAANTTFFTSDGDRVFPFSAPTRDGSAGAIDNMIIGATTPRAATFTTVTVGASAGTTCPTYYFTGTAAATDQVFFVAPRAFRVVSISQVHAVAAGGASTLQVTKDTGTAAPGAGTDLLTNNTNAGFNLNATANTTQVGTLSATASDLLLAAGDRLSVDFAAAIQSSTGVVVTACLAPQ